MIETVKTRGQGCDGAWSRPEVSMSRQSISVSR